MKIAVCVKQSPLGTIGYMDETTGLLKRELLTLGTNIYDLYAIETALRIKDKIDSSVDIFTMGTEKALSVITESFCMGADKGFLVSDKAFAGADVLATSYTLFQAISYAGKYDLIICGKQTTDGDTAQVGGSLAEQFKIPNINNVNGLLDVTEKSITIMQKLEFEEYILKADFLCLISVENGIFPVRMPSLALKLKAKKKFVEHVSLEKLQDKNENNYGLKSSATQVIEICLSNKLEKQKIYNSDSKNTAKYILDIWSKSVGNEEPKGE